jgi:hypothetical protein
MVQFYLTIISKREERAKMYVGSTKRINVTQSEFASFINDGCLYIDKTAFIEHVLQDSNKILLFTRPRRMEYWHEVRASPLPLYKVGVACHGNQCVVTAVRHGN